MNECAYACACVGDERRMEGEGNGDEEGKRGQGGGGELGGGTCRNRQRRMEGREGPGIMEGKRGETMKRRIKLE